MKHRRSILTWTATLIGLAALIHALLLPLLVQRMTIARLHGLGFYNVNVDVDSVKPWRLQLRNLTMGRQDNLHAASVTVASDQMLLLGGAIDTVELADVRFKVRMRNGRFDWSDLWQQTETLEVPFERLVLHGCTVELDYGGPPVQLPLRGQVLHEGDGKMVVDLEAELMNMPLPIEGWFDVRSGDGEIDTTGFFSMFPWFSRSLGSFR